MTDEEYITKAVELADGWLIEHDGKHIEYDSNELLYSLPTIKNCPQPIIDALAAQLVRQVDATMYHVRLLDDETHVFSVGKYGSEPIQAQAIGSDRSMNTIKCIVDSGVLS